MKHLQNPKAVSQIQSRLKTTKTGMEGADDLTKRERASRLIAVELANEPDPNRRKTSRAHADGSQLEKSPRRESESEEQKCKGGRESARKRTRGSWKMQLNLLQRVSVLAMTEERDTDLQGGGLG